MIEHCGLVFRIPPPAGQPDERLVFLGDDDQGTALEVMAVELEGGDLLVIHAMALREAISAPVRGGEAMADLKTKTGTKLSKAAVDELASEAEAGYDLSAAERQRVGPGRPSLGEGESPRISYRVAPALFERLKARAEAEGRTVSDVAREALRKYLAS